MDGAASKAASLLGGAKKNESCFPSLTFKQRLTGFFTCMILGNIWFLLFLNSIRHVD